MKCVTIAALQKKKTYPRVIGSGDFDGDNRPDIIIPNYGSRIVHYKNRNLNRGIKLNMKGDSLNLIGLKARLRYQDGNWGPLYEYSPKYGYRKEAANYFIFGYNQKPEAIEIIGPVARYELPIELGQDSYALPQK